MADFHPETQKFIANFENDLKSEIFDPVKIQENFEWRKRGVSGDRVRFER